MAETSPVEPATRILDLTELKKHTTETDCYLLYDGKVYDVTEFLDEHPGGAMALMLPASAYQSSIACLRSSRV